MGMCNVSESYYCIRPAALLFAVVIRRMMGTILCFYTPRKLCLWWVYCFHVVRASVRAYIRASVRNVLFP